MKGILKAARLVGALLISLLALLLSVAIALLFVGQWVSLLIWCLPLTLSAAIVVFGGAICGYQPGRYAGIFVAACSATSFYWAMFILEPNLQRLPNWLLFLLAMPLDPDGVAHDGRGHQEPGLDMAGLRGIICVVSIASLLCLIGLVIEAVRELRAPAVRTSEKYTEEVPDEREDSSA